MRLPAKAKKQDLIDALSGGGAKPAPEPAPTPAPFEYQTKIPRKILAKIHDEAYKAGYAKDRDNARIHNLIWEEVVYNNNRKGLRAVSDSEGMPQALAIVKQQGRRHLYLEYLATSPWNVKEANDPRRVRGAGTALMTQLVIESARFGAEGRIELEALPGAVAFYEKIGFVFNKSTETMSLSTEAARKFLEQQGITAEFSEEPDEDYLAELYDLEDLAQGAFAQNSDERSSQLISPSGTGSQGPISGPE